MVKKTFSFKLLLILSVVSGCSMLKGMNWAFWGIKKGLTSDFVKDYAPTLLVTSAVPVLWGFKLIFSRFDDLEKLVNEVRDEVKLNGEKIGKNGTKIDELLKNIKLLPTEQQMKQLLDLQKSGILDGQMQQFDTFKNGVENDLATMKKGVVEIKIRLENLNDKFEQFKTTQGLEIKDCQTKLNDLKIGQTSTSKKLNIIIENQASTVGNQGKILKNLSENYPDNSLKQICY